MPPDRVHKHNIFISAGVPASAFFMPEFGRSGARMPGNRLPQTVQMPFLCPNAASK